MNQYSNEFIDYLKRFEDFRPKAYWIEGEYWDKDKKEKKYTIGYGATTYNNSVKVKEGDVITEEDATNLMHQYLASKEASLKKTVTNWDKLPQQVKEGLFSIVYRGGSLDKSPKFAKAVNDAYADGQISTEEYKNILAQMSFNKSGNLQDRMWRNAALLGGMYDYADNESINHATTQRSPYRNFHNNIFYPGNKWNIRWEDKQNLYRSNANFVSRLKDPNRETINLGNGRIGTHLMANANINGQEVLFPTIQELSYYPWWNFLHIGKPSTKLVKFEDAQKALDSAIQNNDTVHIQDPWTAEHYKQFFVMKQGGKVNYLNLF